MPLDEGENVVHHFICTKFLMLRGNGMDFRGRRVFIMKLNVCPKNAACADGEKSCQLWKLVSIVKGVYSQSYPQTNAIRLHFYIVAEKGCLWVLLLSSPKKQKSKIFLVQLSASNRTS